ncbi:MAG: peptide chain release factor N(5)-glutamine methyltransferase [Alistipes sp.]|jgi:release factor glutamine methyltransferase|nr:peptide chain release factor N(5)-glutamine methyltransferase [Alistipes sp.]
MTRRELQERLVAAAQPVYGEREAATIARLVAEKRYGLSRADIALVPGAEVDPGEGFERLLADLAAARPVQYILGVADFDGMELAVGEGVLIPRPETEELVRWISTDSPDAKTILDIGTGSGAIAIALARRLPGARVTGIDISPGALRYARLNNERTGAGVELIEADILNADLAPAPGEFDVIVSNPPYIPAVERARMAANVVDHEPPGALFVPDADPLLFYRAIARFARRSLAPGGTLWFETHETTAAGVVGMLEAEGFADVELREDINSKPRMIRCRP